MNRLRAFLLFLLCWVSAYVLIQASVWWRRPIPANPTTSTIYAAKLAEQRHRLPPDEGRSFNPGEYRGRVLVVCVAALETEGLEPWLQQLAGLYRDGPPAGVEVVWLGVGNDIQEANEAATRLALPFPVLADPLGAGAQHFSHLVDPTLYVVGKWGAVRYSGELPTAKLERMLLLLVREEEHGDHQFFSRLGTDVEHRAPEVVIPDLDGRPVSLYSLVRSARAVCLLLAGPELDQGVKASRMLDGLVTKFGPRQVKACMVYSGVSPQEVRDSYGPLPRYTVILCDESGEAARAFRLEGSGLCLVLNARGTIRYRGGPGEPVEAAVSAVLNRVTYPRRDDQSPGLPP